MTPYQFKVQEPCHENWDDMKPQEQGRFCSSCTKEVVDFTAMSDFEVKNYFLQYQGSLCGRFTKDQLKPKMDFYAMLSPYSKLFVRAFATVFILLMGTQLHAQVTPNQSPRIMGKMVCVEKSTVKVSGNVINEHGQNINAANVEFFRDGHSVDLVLSQEDGSFTINKLYAGTYLMVITKHGYEKIRREVKIASKPQQIFADIKLRAFPKPQDEPQIMGMMIMGEPELEIKKD